MSTRFLDLKDRIVTDTGSMVAKHNLLVEHLLSGKSITDIPFESHPDTINYHVLSGTTRQAQVWQEDDVILGPALDTFDWSYPEEYDALDIEELCIESMEDFGLISDKYAERLTKELTLIEERDMSSFIRCLLWITQTFRENEVVWGLGRGSSCASLVLFLLRINKVDPVRYDIPMEEFYK